MRSLWVRLLLGFGVFLVAVAGGVLGETLFWSPAFIAWACTCVAIGVLTEAWLRWRERVRGSDVADRPVLQRPVEWSIALVAMSALVGSEKTYLSAVAITVPMYLIVIPHARREKRAAARNRTDAAAGSSVDGAGDGVD